MGYRENQFYKFDSQLGRTSAAPGDNPPFLYPGSNRHRLDVARGSQTVKRGFIKSLLDDSEIFANLSAGGTPSEYFNKRMFFQFNPSLISQDVSQSSGALPLLQDPGQLTQPMMGNTTFAFEIMLDRQMEMNRGKASEFFQPGTGPGGTPGLWNTSDPNVDSSSNPADIGIFADLKVLYSIIGQGLSAEQVEIYKSLLKRSTANSSQDSETSADAATTSTVGSYDGVPFTSLDINIGNSAFLAPLPIRIVFSSLFMVDGFVTGTQVLFTKFNANMVPVQARVGLSVQAVYIGFARPKTVFNAALASATEVSSGFGQVGSGFDGTTSVSKGDPEDVKKLGEFENKILSDFRIAVYGNENQDRSWDLPVVGATESSKFLVPNIMNDSDGVAVYCGFPKSGKQDSIYTYLQDGNQFDIQYSFSLRILRDPYPGTDEGEELIELFSIECNSGMGIGMKDSSPVASTVDSWNIIKKMKLSKSAKVTPTYLGGKETSLEGTYLFLTPSQYQNFLSTNKKLRVEILFNMSVNLGSDKGTTSKTYPRSLSFYIPIQNQCVDYTFPTKYVAGSLR